MHFATGTASASALDPQYLEACKKETAATLIHVLRNYPRGSRYLLIRNQVPKSTTTTVFEPSAVVRVRRVPRCVGNQWGPLQDPRSLPCSAAGDAEDHGGSPPSLELSRCNTGFEALKVHNQPQVDGIWVLYIRSIYHGSLKDHIL